ncbi:hypothetical protein OIU85_024412 [Salix viminalis]|uniref:Uncharacterized protein n=1 Tax=Salix viminalis TaxID=40686 RepID=A0A9Q0Z4N6_SALVM|nr:hypothetical protein OIU85_024412 [Salix viminalis]
MKTVPLAGNEEIKWQHPESENMYPLDIWHSLKSNVAPANKETALFEFENGEGRSVVELNVRISSPFPEEPSFQNNNTEEPEQQLG